MDALTRQLPVDHKRAAAQAGIADRFIAPRIGRARGEGGHGQNRGVKLFERRLQRPVSEAVRPCDPRGVVRLQEAQSDRAFRVCRQNRFAAAPEQHLGTVARVQAEVDDRTHVLRQDIAGVTAAFDHGGGNGGADKGKEFGARHAESGEGVRIAAHILYE